MMKCEPVLLMPECRSISSNPAWPQRAPNFFLQFFSLIADLFLRGIDGALKCRIQNGYRFRPLLQAQADFAGVVREQARDIFRQTGLAQALAQLLRSNP